MTREQKADRRLARLYGRRCATAIHNARFPVFLNDGQHYTDLAAQYARRAAHFARRSTDIILNPKGQTR